MDGSSDAPPMPSAPAPAEASAGGERKRKRRAWGEDTEVQQATTPEARIAEYQATIQKLEAQVSATNAADTAQEQKDVILAALSKALGEARSSLEKEYVALGVPPPTSSAVLAGQQAPTAVLPEEMRQRLFSVVTKLNTDLGAAAALPGMAAAAVSLAAANPAARVYVGSLHYELGEREVRAIFGPFGSIAKVDMSHEPSTGKTKGYCFITYDTVEAADRAIAGMNQQVIAGRPIKVSRPAAPGGAAGAAPGGAGGSGANSLPMSAPMPPGMGGGGGLDMAFAAEAAARALAAVGGGGGAGGAPAKPGVRLYVGNVPQEFSAEHLKAVFGPFGAIRSCSLLPSTDPTLPGTHRGYGFLELEDASAGEAAIAAMNGFEIANKKLKVSFATSTNAPGGAPGGGGGGGGGALPADLAGKGMLAAFGLGGGGMGSGSGANSMPMGAMGGMGTGQQQQQLYRPPGGLDMAALAAQAAAAVTGGAYGNAYAPPPPPQPAPPLPGGSYGSSGGNAASRVMCLLNMVGPEEAGDPGLPREVAEECVKYGPVEGVRVAVRRSQATGQPEVGVFVAFTTLQGAIAGVVGLDRRFFGGRVTAARPYPEAAYYAGDFHQPVPA